MKTLSVSRGVVVVGLWVAAAVAFGSCKSSSSTGTGTLPPGVGYCEATCAKTCTQDQDCDTSHGELCCDYGAAGKSCSQAQSCPVSCTDDMRCDSASGQACVRTDLSVSGKICTSPSNAIHLCAADADCATGDVCCTIYNEPICLPPSSCPKACATSTDCQTGNGEICCTSVGVIEPALSASGLCLNPLYDACPKTCTQSSDCVGAAGGAICCDGTCQTTCRKTCAASTDCNQQICCKSALEKLPPPTTIFTTGPHCVGTPEYTCAQCGNSCGTNTCPGCASSGTGSCGGTRSYPCSTFSTSYMNYCVATTGCSWDAGTEVCSGTPVACSTLTTSATCTGQLLDCTWSGTVNCTGTPTPCNQLTVANCPSQPGCSVVTGS